MPAGIMDERSRDHAVLNVQLDSSRLRDGRTFHDSVGVQTPPVLFRRAPVDVGGRSDRILARPASPQSCWHHSCSSSPDAIMCRLDGGALGQGQGSGKVASSCAAVRIRGGQVEGRVSW